MKSHNNIAIYDLGANDGCSIRKMAKEWPEFKLAKVYSFEPNVELCHSDKFKNTLLAYENVELYSKAVATHDGNISFWIHPSYSVASTTYKNKARNPGCGSSFPCSPIETLVPSINIVKHMHGSILNGARLIIKMDIEGAEYDIIPVMIENNIFKFADRLHIEWHERFRESTSKGANQLEKEIINQNPNIRLDKSWNAMGY